jgi:lipoprotein signal peptidase
MMQKSPFLAGGEMQVGALLLSCVFLITVDQTAKAIVVGRSTAGYLLHRKAEKLTPLAVLWLGELIVIGLLVEIGPLAQNAWATIALGAALGGGASNLIDRLHHGGVVDFIDVKIWPVFNIADAAIVIGAGAAAVTLLGGW